MLAQAVRYVMAGGAARVSFETSFDSKQPKLSETKFYSVVSVLYPNREFRCFDLTETNSSQLKQFDREHIFVFFSEKLGLFGLFGLVLVYFEIVCFVSVVSLLYRNRELMFRLNRNKQKTNRNSLIESIFWVFFRKFRVVSVCFKTVLFVSVVLIKVQNTKTNRFFFFHETN
jgi:hypothetical protein